MTDLVRIAFHGDELLATEVDGQPHIVLRPAIEALGLDYKSQYDKLRSKSWAVMGMSPTTGADGKTYQMVTVTVRTLLMLLATIDENRVAVHVRPKLVAYQAEVADVIEAHFAGPPVPAQRPELSNRDLALMVIAEADRADAAEARVAELAPKAAAADALTEVDGALPIGAVANMFGVGRTTLFRILYAEGVLMRDKRPFQRWADAFRVVATTHTTSTGKEVVDYTAYIYPAGAVRLHRLLTRRGHKLRQLSNGTGRPELTGGAA